MSALRLRALLSAPLRDAWTAIYPEPMRRQMDRYYERSAHGGLVFLSADAPTVELVPTPVGAERMAPGVQYVRTRQPWGAPSDWQVMP